MQKLVADLHSELSGVREQCRVSQAQYEASQSRYVGEQTQWRWAACSVTLCPVLFVDRHASDTSRLRAKLNRLQDKHRQFRDKHQEVG